MDTTISIYMPLIKKKKKNNPQLNHAAGVYTCVTGFAPNTPQSAPGNLCNSKTWMDVLPQLQDEQQAGKYLRDTSVYRNGFDCYEYNSSNCRGGEFLQERDTSSAT